MMLNQQLEAEADASKKERLRQQLDDLNKGEQEQLQTEIEPVDLDAIANEYLRPDIEEHPDSRNEFIESERSTDPEQLCKQWRSPLDAARSKNERLENQGVRAENSLAQARQSLNERIDNYAEEYWHEHAAPYVAERDELSSFLNLDDRKMSQERDFDKSLGRQSDESISRPIQNRQVMKSEPKRDDELFGR